MKLVIELDDNASAKSIAAKLRMQAGILEGMTPKEAASRKNTDGKTDDEDEDEETEEEDEDEDDEEEKPKKKKSKKVADDEDEDEDDEVESDEDEDDSDEDEESDEDEDEDEDPPPKKKKKGGKKVTVADVNDACKKRAKAGGKKGRKEVLAILKKNFKTESISDIKPEKYAAVIAAMEV